MAIEKGLPIQLRWCNGVTCESLSISKSNISVAVVCRSFRIEQHPSGKFTNWIEPSIVNPLNKILANSELFECRSWLAFEPKTHRVTKPFANVRREFCYLDSSWKWIRSKPSSRLQCVCVTISLKMTNNDNERLAPRLTGEIQLFRNEAAILIVVVVPRWKNNPSRWGDTTFSFYLGALLNFHRLKALVIVCWLLEPELQQRNIVIAKAS